MPSIDIDRDAARQAAQAELDKAIYSKGSAVQQFIDWVDQLVYRVLQQASSIPGGWFTAAVLVTLLAVAVAVGVHIARRTLRSRRGDHQLFQAAQLTAAQHRASAERFAAEGNWTAAIRHRVRGVARQLEEAGVLTPAPGRTANELARDAGSALPHLSVELSQAATAFNDVTYGAQPGTQAAYQMIAALDERLRRRSPAAAMPGHPAAAHAWARVRR